MSAARNDERGRCARCRGKIENVCSVTVRLPGMCPHYVPLCERCARALEMWLAGDELDGASIVKEAGPEKEGGG